ncbi:hypothetical protein SKAU_G00069830 [Synaphobranchus kaupii]|uniref:Uncharacterized protein n=1 Tax=Synaphobranchus kaupii TaxID=118154 RepID=A0A9Q1G6I0_SYNKA|nr:hypothetical protein SKAU_G00069830 [Synaphobranchus kaupii]
MEVACTLRGRIRLGEDDYGNADEWTDLASSESESSDDEEGADPYANAPGGSPQRSLTSEPRHMEACGDMCCFGNYPVTVIQTGPGSYLNSRNKACNEKGGPLDCHYGNPSCEYGDRGGTGWECLQVNPRTRAMAADPAFWDSYAQHIWGLSPHASDHENSDCET